MQPEGTADEGVSVTTVYRTIKRAKAQAEGTS